MGRPYPFGAYLHLLEASTEVSWTLWSTRYFPRDLEAMVHWTLDHLPNVSSVIIIVHSILCFQCVGHSIHTYLRATPMAP